MVKEAKARATAQEKHREVQVARAYVRELEEELQRASNSQEVEDR